MTPPASTPTTRRPSLRALLVAAAIVAATAPLAAAQEPAPNVSRVRAADPKAAYLLAKAPKASPAVARLLDALEQSDLYVYVETGLLRDMGLRNMCGAMRIVAATPSGRFVRISINVPGVDANLIGALAHELQHAVEVAGQPEVKDAAGLLRFYQANGYRKSDGTYCTREATQMTSLARSEVNSAVMARASRK
jgi:hypothetical protein